MKKPGGERQIPYDFTYMRNQKTKETERKQTHRHSEETDGCQEGGERWNE